MKRSIAISLGILVLVVLVLGGVYASNIKAMIDAGEAMSGPNPTTVEIREAETDRWRETLTAIGSVSAVRGATLRAEADGRIEEILFEGGESVEAGAELVRLDTAVEDAQLAVAKAAAELAKATVDRVRELHRREGVSDAELDSAEAAFRQAIAQVTSQEEAIRLKTLRAPFAGRVGVQRLSLGQFINRGDELVSLQALEQVRVEFDLPQAAYSKLSVGLPVQVTSDTWPDRKFPGHLSAIEPEINPRSRNLSAQAILDNKEVNLLPGMFVRVEVIPEEDREVVMVPQTAIRYATFGNAVFVVAEEAESELLKATQRLVRLGGTRGDFVEVTEGLEAGERVVSAGVFKLRDGNYVQHNSKGTLEPELNPTPPNR